VDANGLAGCDGGGGGLAKGCCAHSGGCTLDSCCSFGVSRYVCVHGGGRGGCVCVCVCVCVFVCVGVSVWDVAELRARARACALSLVLSLLHARTHTRMLAGHAHIHNSNNRCCATEYSSPTASAENVRVVCVSECVLCL
jgi:hypothetical protein